MTKTDYDAPGFGKWVLAAVFVATITTANLTAAKIGVYPFPLIGDTIGSVAAFMIGVGFLATDLTSELYGKQTARYIVNSAIISVAVAYAVIEVALAIPPAPFYDGSAFTTVFEASTPVLIASIVGLLISQNLDVEIFHWIRDKTGSSHKWLRNIGSTAVSQGFDTVVFNLLAFAVLPVVFDTQPVPFAALSGIIIAEYIIKAVVAGSDTIIFYTVTELSGGDYEYPSF
jgi:conserved hypothetical integral membrane protein